jgi:hypothetical protein
MATLSKVLGELEQVATALRADVSSFGSTPPAPVVGEPGAAVAEKKWLLLAVRSAQAL